MSEPSDTSSPPQDAASSRDLVIQDLLTQSLLTQDPMHHLELAADIVAAYVSNNSVTAADLPRLINEIHGALRRVGAGGPATVAAEPPKPAVPAKKSVTDEYIICLEDGRKFKSLKRHLRTQYDLSPEQYREKWGLPADYPMVAPSYAKARSNLAKEMGLGQQRRRRG